MRLNSDYVLREIAGDYVLVPTGEAVAKFNGLFGVSEVGARILELLPECTDEASVVSRIVDEYDIDEETAKKDVEEFIADLREKEIITE